MKNYRTLFLAALAGNIVLLGALGGAWWHWHSPAPASRRGSAMRASPTPMSAPMSGSPPASPASIRTPLAPLQISPQRLQSIGVKIGEVRRKRVQDDIHTTGNVAVAETRLAYVQVRFSGYLQKVFVDSTYRYVREGQPLFTIYSPELVAAEREYLVARHNQERLAHSTDRSIVADAASLVNAALARLQQWQVPKREIARLKATGRVQQDLTIDSPATGYVTEREALPNKYVKPDTRLYTVADLSRIWVFAQVFQNDLGRLAVGDPATVTVDTYPGRTFTGRVDFIYPDISIATRTARVRLAMPNPHLLLMPGMFVNVVLRAPMGRRLVIPAAGVLQTGTRAIAFVDLGGGDLEPRQVELGAQVGGEFIVLGGLKAGERIVTSANFLIDSESQLQAALGTFAAPPPVAGSAGGGGARKASIALFTDPNPPRKGDNRVRVTIKSAGGAPMTGANVTATFVMPGMPAMGMAGVSVPVSLSDKGNGTYAGTAHLGGAGPWQVTVVARKSGQVIASQQLSVSAAGGM